MSRLSSSGRTPISERIKIFDKSAQIRPTPSTPTKVKVETVPASPVLKPVNAPRSQFSAKDPTNPKPSVKKSPTNSISSSKSDLSRTPSNVSTKSDVSRSPSNASTKSDVNRSPSNASSKADVSRSPSSSLNKVDKTTNAKNSPSLSKKAVSSPLKKTLKSTPSRSTPTPKATLTPPKQETPKTTSVAPAPVDTVDRAVSNKENHVEVSSSVDRKVSAVTDEFKSVEISRKKSSVFEKKVSVVQSDMLETISDTTEVLSKKMSTVDILDSEVVIEKNRRNHKVSNGLSVNHVEHVQNHVEHVQQVEIKRSKEESYWAEKALNNPTAESISKVKSEGMKIDLESRDEKISALNREISDIQMGGATEDEVRSLKKTKKDLEMQLKDQEEELDDLAAQVQMLEGSKTKIEMEMAAIKKEHRREMTNRDEEIEEARASASKKVKILEQQLEQEHEERIMFLRERHELEQKIGTLQDMLERSGDEEQVAKLKKDLRKTKALLRDAQLLVEKTQNEGTNKVILRQLKNQLEDAEFARTAAMKARQNAELELADTQLQLEDVSRSKQDLEEKHLRVSREKAEFASQLQENEEELQDVMRKYKASVAAVSTDQITIQDQQSTIQELEEERNKLRDAVAELSSKLGNLEGENVSTAQHKRLELKIRELESKLELELTSRSRLETQIIRLKETIEKITKEKDEARLREQQSSDQIKKHSRQIREMKEDYVTVQGKEIELSQKKNDLEKQLEVAEAETLTVRSDLKLALKRIEDLQAALAGEMDSDNSDDNSDSSDDEMHSFLEHHRRAMSVQRERESMARESIVRESMGRDSSILRESVTREVRSNGARTFASIDESRESISMDASKLSSTIAEIDESQA